MRSVAAILIGTGIAATAAYGVYRHDSAGPVTIAGTVVKVTDGDTLQVFDGTTTHRIRLAHVDAPESNQPGGREAEAWLESRLIEKPVTVHVQDTDRYGRTVGVVYIEGQVAINRQLVQHGHAWWYGRYSKDYTYGLDELSARRAGVGLWAGDSDDVAPWEFRKR